MKSVYVISAGERCQKIGISNSPARRMQTLQVDAPSRLSLVVAIKHGRARDIEFTAHHILKGQRIQGEWFDVTSDEAVSAVKSAITHIVAGRPVPYRVVLAKANKAPSEARWTEYLTAAEAARVEEIDRELAEIASYMAQRQVIANRALQRARYAERKPRSDGGK